MPAPVQSRRSPAARIGRGLVRLILLGLVCAPLPVALSQLSGIGHRWTDILAQFTGPAAVAILILTALLLLARRWRWALAAAGTSVIALAAAWGQWIPARETPDPASPSLTVYSANLWARNGDVDAIRASIDQARPDVLILIELGGVSSSRLDDILEGYPNRVATPLINRPGAQPARSVIASTYPLRDLRLRAPDVHVLGVLAETPLGPVNIVGAHLTRPWPFQYQWGQIIQTMQLADLRRGLDGPVVLAGDFNSVSNARIGEQVKSELGLVPASGFPGTWPSALPSAFGVAIDQVWRSPDLAFVSRRLGRPNGSDHRPVVTVISRSLSPAAPAAPRDPTPESPPRSTPPRTP